MAQKAKKMTDKQLYKAKNALLEERGFRQVTPAEFYRDMFPEGSLGIQGQPEIRRPNMICTIVEKDEQGNSKAYNRLIFDDLEDLALAKGAEFAVAAPLTYRGRNRTAANAHHLWGICIDLDGVELRQLTDLLYQIRSDIIPAPTYLVNSGRGFHVYYLFEQPIPLYQHLHGALNDFKYGLTSIVWNQYTSNIEPERKQFQGIFQGFRMPGSQSKLGRRYPVVAYCVGNKTSVETINRYIPPEHALDIAEIEKSRMSMEQAKRLYPEWYERRIVRKEPCRNKWDIAGKVHGDNPYALYDWWVQKLHNGAFDGNRYNCIAVLMVMGVKCDMDKAKVLNDALGLVPWLNSKTEHESNPFTEEDVYDAYTFFADSYSTFSIRAIEAKTKIRIPRNKRNGRKQAEHLRRARAVQVVDYPDGEWRNKDGRPSGSGTAQQKVAAYRAEHPDASVTEVARALGISRPTVYKWWEG